MRTNYQFRPGTCVPAERIRGLIETWLADEWHTKNLLAARTGIGPRRVWGILSGEQETVTVRVADAILVGIGREELWYLSPEDGGLSDIYFHPRIVGKAS